jgi:beta-1,4-N-acetylglucosaminyltransferase
MILKNHNNNKKRKKKVLFISSTGGHFDELMQLKSLFEKYEYHIVTEKTKTNQKLKNIYGQKISFLIYGTKKEILKYFFKFSANIFKSLYIYLKIHPKVVVTTGTHTAVPMCYIAKLFGSKVIFIETFANRTTKTASGKLIYPIADTFVVQWEEMKNLYPKAEYWGWIY